MNTIIKICESRIKISNSYTDKAVRDIVELKLIFFQNHNLLMYLKVILTQLADKSDSSEMKELDSSVSLSEDDEPLS